MEPIPPEKPNWIKRITGILFLAILLSAVGWFFGTDAEAKIRKHAPMFGSFVQQHAVLAPLVYIGIYLLLSILALPVWPLQMLGGFSFGLIEGVSLSVVASTIGSTIAVALSRWFAGDWFHHRVEDRMEKLKKLDEILGHNGFLVVMTVRLIHFLPFGICNYALGLTLVSYTDVILGTLLGGIPACMWYVGLGTHTRPWRNWKFDLLIATINIILLLPLILRYLRPKWFKNIGVE
jgi:uncharacterized membrane protein YdjX (TVP38/TMEM64 family)